MIFFSNFRKKARIFYDSFYCKEIPTKKEIGSNGCSWFVDTAKINSDSIIYSGGAGGDISFELQLINKYKCGVFLFDPSDTGINTVEAIEKKEPLLNFKKVGLDKYDGVIEFSKPIDPDEGSYSIKRSDYSKENIVQFQCRSISSLMKEYDHTMIDLLKIDIEGFEYGVLEDIIENNIEVKQICVEFHHFFAEIPKSKTKRILGQLKNNGYSLIHKRMLDYTLLKHGS